MLNTKNKFAVLAVILCTADVLLTLFSVLSFFIQGGSGNMTVLGARCFIFFTVDSNILCAVSSAIAVPYLIKSINNVPCRLPKNVFVFRFLGTTAVTLTFLTVVCFLGPIQGYRAMFDGTNLFLHLICPLISVISLIFFEYTDSFGFNLSLLGILPTVVYGAVYFYMVLILGAGNGGWHDFYGFNMGGRWYVSVPVILAATFVITLFLRFLNIKCNFSKGRNNR